MVEDIDPRIIGITESWANKDIADVELGLTVFVYERSNRKKGRESYFTILLY